MSLNWKEIDLTLWELDFTGAFIQQIVQPGYESLALYTYKASPSGQRASAKTVLVHLAPGVCRIHETRQKIPKNDKPLRFMEFLKSRIKGAKITSCGQIGRERVILLELSKTGAEGGQFRMYIRLWSNAANIIVTDAENTVLDTFYRRPGKDEVTGGKFAPPVPDQPRDAPKSDLTAQTAWPAKSWEVRDFHELVESGTVSPQDLAALCFNEKIDLWYREYAQTLSRDALLEQAEKFYTGRLTKMENALSRLEEKRSDFLHAVQWKHQGDLILSFGHLMDGSSKYLECEDYEAGVAVRIKIDPQKSVQENAAKCYKTYKKAVSGLEELETDIARAKREIRGLEAAYEAMQREPNPIKIQQLIRRQNKPKQQIGKKYPGLSYTVEGWHILAGRTASENDELLRRHVRGQDMWFHARDFAGGYVFVKHQPGKTIPLEIMLYAGTLAVYHSKARKNAAADLYYTQVKYLRRAKNGPKGLVLPTQEKNLYVKLEGERLKKLEDCQDEE
jgi:predicted ribosome quality control (RQC) complex YloA/Tae2 family protein